MSDVVLQRRFDRAADTFDGADFVHRATCDGLLERLRPINVASGFILDLGSATGAGSRSLARHFKRSRVTALDLSHAMARKVRQKRPFLSKISALQGDARQLPLRDASMDLVFANLLIPWIEEPENCFTEVNRVLKKDGVFAFSTLGPDSLSVLRDAWRAIDDESHVHTFADMHLTGDALVRAGLRDPVLDVDRLTVSYRSTNDLFRDLKNTGARNCLTGRRRSLTGKDRFRAMNEKLEALMDDGVLPVELELVYGHAWGGGPQQRAGEFRLDPAAITRRDHRA